MPDFDNFVNGRFVTSSGIDRITVKNPATGEFICTVPSSTATDVEVAVAAAEKACLSWSQTTAAIRGKMLKVIAEKLRLNKNVLARVITEEQGKTLSLARLEVEFSADYLHYMAEWGRRIEGEVIQSDRPKETILLFRQPIGVIGGILPWNFPFFLIVRKVGSALIAGNTIVIKPSEETPHCAVKFAELIAELDLPPGIINVVHGTGPLTGHSLASSPRIGMISFTGSVQAGSAIMAAAASNIAKVNLELGGKAPAIVMADADIDLVVQAIKSSRVINSAQVCNCVERVYVHQSIATEFTGSFKTPWNQLATEIHK